MGAINAVMMRWATSEGYPLAARLDAFSDADRDHLRDRVGLRGVAADDLAVILDRRPACAVVGLVGDEVRHQ